MSDAESSGRERCPDCKAEQRFHEQGFCPHEIETGERISESPLTGETYRVTKWVDRGEGGIIALHKERVDRPVGADNQRGGSP